MVDPVHDFSVNAAGTLELLDPRADAPLGFCPSGRLFEAAACGVPVLSDPWPGLDALFAPDEILVADSTDAAVDAIERPRDELARIGRRARARAVEDHSSTRRAAELLALLAAPAGAPS